MRQSKKSAMYKLVKDWQSSGQKKSDFCISASINIHTFTYWHQKYKKESIADDLPNQEPNFLPFKVVKDSVISSAKTIDLHYPNGIRLSLPKSVEVNYIAQLLQISV